MSKCVYWMPKLKKSCGEYSGSSEWRSDNAVTINIKLNLQIAEHFQNIWEDLYHNLVIQSHGTQVDHGINIHNISPFPRMCNWMDTV